jgi:hypothetical protein
MRLLLLPFRLQVPIFACLYEFDGATINDDIRQGRRKFRVTRLPCNLTALVRLLLPLCLHVLSCSQHHLSAGVRCCVAA